MSVSELNLTGFVLAGGKSSRFGSDKSLAPINGKPMISYSLDLLKSCCQAVYVNRGKKEKEVYPDIDSIGDLIPDIGPMGGIYSCLNASATDYNLILTCDMPGLSSEMIKRIIDVWQRGRHEIIISKDREGNLYPFPGIYSKACIPVLRQLILNHNYKIQNLIRQMQVGEYLLNEGDERYMVNYNYADPSVFG